MNRWNIPDWLEREIIKRDSCCVYCGVDFTAPSGTRSDKPSWEHIVNDAGIITRANIARCCVGCNASKGTKNLEAISKTRNAVGAALSLLTPVESSSLGVNPPPAWGTVRGSHRHTMGVR